MTAHGPNGPAGFTATGFSSVSLAPPLVLVCVGKRASAHDAVVAAPCFGVSILSEGQAWIADQFARSGIDRFGGVPLLEVAGREHGVPLVDGAVGSLECRPHRRFDAGDHTILVGEVVATIVGAGRPLVHWARSFGAFVPAGVTPMAVARAASEQGGSTWANRS